MYLARFPHVVFTGNTNRKFTFVFGEHKKTLKYKNMQIKNAVRKFKDT